jgi:hypothetical protein
MLTRHQQGQAVQKFTNTPVTKTIKNIQALPLIYNQSGSAQDTQLLGNIRLSSPQSQSQVTDISPFVT